MLDVIYFFAFARANRETGTRLPFSGGRKDEASAQRRKSVGRDTHGWPTIRRRHDDDQLSTLCPSGH